MIAVFRQLLRLVFYSVLQKFAVLKVVAVKFQRDLELVVRTLMKLKLLLGDGVPSDEAEEIPGTAVISLYEEFRQ